MLRKQIKQLLLAFGWLALPMLVHAQFFYSTNNGTITITAYRGDAINVIIPATINSYPVTSIEYYAFYEKTGLTSVSIADSVTNIGKSAFGYCPNLVGINVNAGNPAYSSLNGVLFDKKQATLIQLPGGLVGDYVIPQNVTTVNEYAFDGCTHLTGVIIPNTVMNLGIEGELFQSCTSLKSITVSAANTTYSSLNGVLFDKAQTTLIEFPESLGGNYTIPSNVTKIEKGAFSNCQSLASVTIPNSVGTIGDFAFNFCFGLTSVSIPDSITNIGETEFLFCSNLTNINVNPNNPAYSSSNGVLYDKAQTTLIECPQSVGGSYIIPATVTNISDSAFYLCVNLTNVLIPNSLVTIADSAFNLCGLKSVTIPNSVTNIELNVFSSCPHLAAINVAADNPAYSSLNGVLFDKTQSALIQFPEGMAGSYVIPNSVANLAFGVFSGCANLTSLTIPSNLTNSLVANYFIGCTQLTNITVNPANPNFSSLNGVLFDKTQTTLILFPEGLPGNYIIPDNVTSIGNFAFGDCTGLTSVTIPSSITNMGLRAFGDCINLKSAYFFGNAPPDDGSIFMNVGSHDPATVYHLADAVGWSSKFGGAPTAVWNAIGSALISVSITGRGTTTPNYNGVYLQLNKQYSMTAVPAVGFAFTNWTDGNGSVITNRPALKFIIESNLLVMANFVDIQKPTLSITNLPANGYWSNSQFTVRGKASDNVGVSNVFYNLNNTGWQTTGVNSDNSFTNWNALLTLVPGANSLAAYAQDAAGNLSPTNTVRLTYILSGPLTVSTSGRGTITPNDNNAYLQIGNRYSLTAAPAAGFAFTNWTDGGDNLVSTNRVLSFTMLSNLVFTANFVDILKPTITVTAPTASTSPVGEFYVASGKASDNVAVSNVWCKLNSGVWFNPSGTTNWTVALDLVPGTNYFAAYAVDAAGNCSATNTVKFLYTTAPGSLNGFSGAITAAGNDPSQFVAFGLVTFSQWAADTNSGDNAVGSYTYTRQSPSSGQLKITYTAPPSVTNAAGAQTIQLTFTSPNLATFTNLTTADTGEMAFTSTPAFAPASLAGKTWYAVDSQGNGGLIHFTASQAIHVSLQSVTNHLNTFTYKVYSPVGGLVKETNTNGVDYTVVTFQAAATGLSYSESYDIAATNLTGEDLALFGLASQRPGGNAPTNLVNRTAVVTTDGITGQLNFTDTVNFTDVNPLNNSVTNGYGSYLYTSSTNTASLNLSYFSPPQAVGFNLLFVSPTFAIFTNTVDGTLGSAVFK